VTTASRPTLAVCVPAFNATSYLPRLFDGIAKQVVPFDEVLVYDDASTDGTAEMARSYGATVLRGATNRGCSFGKNELAALARSDWLHFCDADDERMPHFVESARAWMESTGEHDVVMMSYEDRDPDGTTLRTQVFDDEALRRDALRAVILRQHSNCGIYRRTAFLRAGGFDTDPAVLYNEDDALHVRLALEKLHFRAEDKVAAVIYQRVGSMSRTRPVACLRSKFHVLAKAAERAPNSHRDVLALQLWRCAGSLAGFSEWEYAERCVRIAAHLGRRSAPEGKAYFRLTSRISPTLALRIRERAIRLFRPHLRPHLRPRAEGLA
jgi:glycosyltransferase involved in cell wall biosynthesis